MHKMKMILKYFKMIHIIPDLLVAGSNLRSKE